jgi:hypothetical protein
MTIDKETLIKHRFWIALGVFVVLLLVGVILIPTVQGSINDTYQKKFLASKKAAEGIPNNPKSPFWRKPLEEKESELKGQKGIVWRQAWEPRSDLMTWPEGGSARLSEKLSNAYFGDYIAPNDRSEYGAKLYKQYLDSLHLADIVKPAEFSGSWEAILTPVGEWDVNSTPTIEEIWLAQEDLWVKRELLGIIRATLDGVRIFNEVPPDKDAKEDPLPPGAKRQRMRNANWELNLVLEPDPKNGGMVISANSTLKNINPWKRTLTLADVPFRVRQGEGNHFDFSINVDQVAANETIKFPRDIPFKLRADLDKPLLVEQILTWETSPIKRIDRVALGYNSHRTANRAVKAKPIGPQSEEDKKDKTADTSTSSSNPGAAMYANSPGRGGMGIGVSGGKPLNKYLQRERYLDFTEQVRWMPVGLVLIVDQEYMQDVQVAVANSRLRIQPTQIAYHRAHGVRSMATRGGNSPIVSGPSIGGGILAGGASRGGKFASMMSGGAGAGPATGGVTLSQSVAGAEEDPNLLELSIYGIASLYERFPPKPPAGAKP